jgi:hypothetical protein
VSFQLPDVHDIAIDVVGRTFDGSWSIVLGEMVVYYNGHTSGVENPEENHDEIARGLLRELVREHYVPLEAIAADLPAAIREAAHLYINNLDDEDSSEILVDAFGDAEPGSAAHRQLSWLCVNALTPIVPFWKLMCDSDGPEQTLAALRRWLDDPATPVDWSAAGRPEVALRDGEVVADCDACRLEPTAAAVAATATYLQSADASLAVAALDDACCAWSEGCHPEEKSQRFETWLVLNVLPKAFAGAANG